MAGLKPGDEEMRSGMEWGGGAFGTRVNDTAPE